MTLDPVSVPDHLDAAERGWWRAVQTFEEKGPPTSPLSRLAAAPLEAMMPDRLRAALQDGMAGMMHMARTTGSLGIDPAGVLGPDAPPLEEILEADPIDTIADRFQAHIRPAVLSATLQGAGLGMGGVMLAAADVPLLMTMHLRLLVRLGVCAGLDLRALPERRFLLGMVELGYCLRDREERKRTLRHLGDWVLRREVGHEEETADLARTLLMKSAGTFVEKVVPVLLRRRVGAALPLLGSAIGAGANYALTGDVVEGSRHVLLKRVLVHRAARRAEGAPAPGAQGP